MCIAFEHWGGEAHREFQFPLSGSSSVIRELSVKIEDATLSAKIEGDIRVDNYLDGRSLILGQKTGGRVTSLYVDLFHHVMQ